METSVIVAVATTSQSLATFIKQELSETNVAVQLLTDPELFFKRLKNIRPELILLDASYPTGGKSAGLAKTLQQDITWKDIPLVVIKTFFEPLDESFPKIAPENILTQPFTRSDLLAVLQRVAPRAISNHQEGENMGKTDGKEKTTATAGNVGREMIIELTDVVEEGLPLEQLPPLAAAAVKNNKPIDDTETAQNIPAGGNLEKMEFPGDKAIDELLFSTVNTEAATNNQEESREKSPPAGDIQEDALIKQELEDTLDFSELSAIEAPAAGPAEMPGNLMEDDLRMEPEAAPSPAETVTAENPEDYLTPDEEEMLETTAGDSPSPPETAENQKTAETETTRPSVVTEPPTVDFSHQIEELTQEWSKKMLVSTYASMDKLIQALGDMAPTIVEQVAREIIPPLAEKIIKSEIKRLEEKIEDNHT